MFSCTQMACSSHQMAKFQYPHLVLPWNYNVQKILHLCTYASTWTSIDSLPLLRNRSKYCASTAVVGKRGLCANTCSFNHVAIYLSANRICVLIKNESMACRPDETMTPDLAGLTYLTEDVRTKLQCLPGLSMVTDWSKNWWGVLVDFTFMNLLLYLVE